MSLWHIITVFLLVEVAVSQWTEDPLCVQKACPATTTCRIIKECASPQSCELKAKCLDNPPQWSHTGVCQIGQPVLEFRKGIWDDLSCYESQPCPQGFYCNTELQDTYAVCCRSDPTNTVRPGMCPANTRTDDSYCLDTCVADGDCRYNYKCCKKGCNFECRTPKMADPCEKKTCPENSYCLRPNMPQCTAPGTCWQIGDCITCPPVCRKYCEHGMMTDPNGCKICKCNGPPMRTPPPPVPSSRNQISTNQNTNVNAYGGVNQRGVNPSPNNAYQRTRNPFNNWFWMHMMNNFFF